MIVNEIIENLLASDKPSDYFEFLRRQSRLSHFPELFSLIITPQEPDWHPEGTVWSHTMMVIDVAAELKSEISSDFDREALMFGALCHDFGKPYSTIFRKDKFKSPMHDSLGIAPAYTFLNKIGMLNLFPKVSAYIIEHLKPIQLFNSRDHVSNTAIIRLNKRLDIYDLVRLAKSDHWGRTDQEAIERVFPAGDWLIERFEAIGKKHR